MTARSVLLKTGRRVLRALDRPLARASLVPNTPFLPNNSFPWCRELEASWQAIRSEADRAAVSAAVRNIADVSPEQSRLAKHGGWKVFFFFGYGHRSDANCALCPTTADLLSGIPGINLALFSVLEPGASIPEHVGPYKGLIRYHLGLTVPVPDQCGLRVASEVRHWREGEGLLFDDTHPHEAWNRSQQRRVVLMLDVVRPLKEPWAITNRAILQLIASSPYVQTAVRNQVQRRAE